MRLADRRPKEEGDMSANPGITGERTCKRCRHSSDWHRLDDAQNVGPDDPAAKFRCIGYDCTAPGPPPPGGQACDCPDMVD